MSAFGNSSHRITFADVLAWAGNVPGHRVLCWPPAGRATPEDLDTLNGEGAGRYELVAGVVERAGGAIHSRLRDHLAGLLTAVLPQVGPARVRMNQRFQLDRFLVRYPDIGLVISEEERVPALVVEVLHTDNTTREMEIKLAEFSRYGVKLVWYVDPERKEVDVYPKGNPKRKRTLGVNDTLEGGDVLPGFAVKVERIFESRAPAGGNPKAQKGKTQPKPKKS